MKHDPIMVWGWRDAPEDLKYIHCNGDDIDWVAVVPPEWAEYGHTPLVGMCVEIDQYPHPDPTLAAKGWEVHVGSHA